METESLPESCWNRLSQLVATTTGLHFPRERWPDLQRGAASAARELGFPDLAAWVGQRLFSPTKAELDVLVSHLTVGETYFFRDRKTFEVLAEHVLPDLLLSRKARDRRLRIWSAACCTGEEPYSLSIFLQQVIPDLESWHATILATDINERFLRKAGDGVYGGWSFRDSPAWFKERYFEQTSDSRYAIRPEIRKRITFAPLNLVEDVFPSPATDTNAMDIIFCRNVLMYFAPEQARKVVENLRRSLVDGGWLVVSASEASPGLFPDWECHTYPGTILYRKRPAGEPKRAPTRRNAELPVSEEGPPARTPAAPCETKEKRVGKEKNVDLIRPRPAELARAVALHEQGRSEEAVETLFRVLESEPNPRAFALLARVLANQGRFAEARAWCERWIATDKLNVSAYYLSAMIAQESGDSPRARRCLQRALYLDQDFILGHFALGNLARGAAVFDEAKRHFAHASQLLHRLPPEAVLPESDGLTAGRLAEIIDTLRPPALVA